MTAKVRPLTSKQILYSNGIIAGKTKRDAFRDAKYKIKNDKAMDESIRKLTENSRVQDYISKRMNKLATQADVKAIDIINTHKAISEANITDVVSWDEEGCPTVIPSEELSEDTKKAIKKIKFKTRKFYKQEGKSKVLDYVQNELEFEMYNKQHSLDKLGEHKGLWTAKDNNDADRAIQLIQNNLTVIHNKYGIKDAKPQAIGEGKIIEV